MSPASASTWPARCSATHVEYLKVTAASAEEAIRPRRRPGGEGARRGGGLPVVEVVRRGPRAHRSGRRAGAVGPEPGLDRGPAGGAGCSPVPELAGLSVRAQNDNRLSVLTEIDHRPGESFIYLRGSTGIGGAVVLEGALLDRRSRLGRRVRAYGDRVRTAPPAAAAAAAAWRPTFRITRCGSGPGSATTSSSTTWSMRSP